MEARERPLALARGLDVLDDAEADVAHSAHAEADVVADGREVSDRFVDIGRQHVDLHAAALVEVDGELVAGVADAGEQRRHVLGRVVRLQIGGPVAQDAVRGRVRLVERVVGERQQDVPQRLDGGGRVAVREHARAESLVLLVELGLLLLAHRSPQDVGLAEGEAGDALRDRHHLLLVDDQSVAGVQDVGERLGELRVDRGDLLLAVLSQRVIGMRVRPHGAGPIQRDDGRDVFEVVGLHQAQQRPHRAAVELEDAERVAAPEQLVGGAVIERQIFEHRPETAVRLDVVEGVIDDREVAKPQEVHLDQPERLGRRVVELGDDLPVLLPLHDRDDVDERFARHDDAGRVHAPLPLQTLEAARRLEHASRIRIGVDHGADVAGLLVALVVLVVDAGQRDVLAHDGRGHRLGELLPHAEREAEHTAGVLERLLGLDGAVGDDLGDALVAVLLGHVSDDLAATALVEVDIEVGHRDAVRVQEPLEDQSVHQRIEVGDAHRVGGHRSGTGATAGTDADAVLLRPVDEVGDDQEVAGEAHLEDDADLVVGLLADRVGNARRVAIVQAVLDLGGEPGVLGVPLGDREARHVVRRGVELDLAALGDQQGVVARLRIVAEELPHLRGGLQIELVGVELEAVRVIERRTRLHAQQRRVRPRVVRVRVVQVVRGDERETEILREPDEIRHDALLDPETVIHDLGEVVLLAEDVTELGGGRDRLAILAEPEPRLHLAARASGGRDQAFAVGLQQFAVHAGLEVVALDRGETGEPEQVVHSGGALGQQRHVRVGARAGDVVSPAVAPAHAGLVGAVGAGRQVGLGADDRLHAGVARLAPEVECAEVVAVVGDRDGGHPLLGDRRHQVGDARCSVQHRVLAVNVQVHEGIAVRHALSGRWDGDSPRVNRRAASGSVGAQEIERVLQIRRVDRFELDRLVRRGVPEAETHGVQPLPSQPEPGRESRVAAVERVTRARVLLGRHVHADLVSSPGLEVHLQEGRATHRLERVVVRHARLAVGRDGELPAGARMAADRRVDRAGERVGMALHDRVVDLGDLAVVERALQPRVGPLALGDDHQPAGADVEAVDDAGTLGGARGRDAEPRVGEGAEHGRAFPADRGMRRHPDGLVDHHDVVVVEHDAEVGNTHRHDARLGLRRPLDREPGARPDAIRLGDDGAVQFDAAGRDDLRGEGAGEAEQLGDGGVDALAVESIGDGEGATLGHEAGIGGSSVSGVASFGCAGARVPSRPTPRSDSRMNSPMLETIAMSAILKIAGK